MAEKEEKIELEGEVLESFRAGMYRIGLDNGHEHSGTRRGRCAGIGFASIRAIA